MNTWLVVGGSGIALWGLIQLAVTIRNALPRFQVAQGAHFVEMGLAFIVLGALPPGPLRTSLATVLLVGALWTAVVQHRLQRAWRREHGGALNRAEGET
jgi:hypothetical protein